MNGILKTGEGSGIAAVAAMILAIVAQLVLRHVSWVAGLVLYGLAIIVFGLAVRRGLAHSTDVVADDAGDDLARTGSNTWPRRSVPLFLAALLLLMALWINADTQHLGLRVWMLQLGGLVMVLVAGVVADWGRVASGPLPESSFELPRWGARVALALIVLAGAWLRFRNLDSLPFGFWFDEADVALIARRMAEDSSYRPVFIEVMPGYHGYIIAILFSLFGESVMAVRGVSAAFGIGTILAGYLAGRELLGRSAGLILAFLIAFSRWSLTLSRVGMHNVTVPFFSLMMLGLTLRAYRRRSTLDWVLAGLFAGGGMIFYSAMSASILALAIVAFVLALRSRDRFQWAVPRFAAALLTALIVFAPLGHFVMEEGDVYFARNRITAIWSDSAAVEDGERWSAVQDNVVTYASMTHYRGDPNGRHNLPGEPMLPPVVAGLVILGLAAAAFRVARPMGVLALVWTPLALMPGVLSLPWEAPNSLRAVAALPVSLVLATAALVSVFPVVASSVRLRRVFLALAGVALVGTGIWEVTGYFGRQANDFAVWAQHSAKETMAANLIVDAGPQTQSHRVGFLEGQKSLDFIVGPSPAEAFFGTDISLPLASSPDHDALILTVPETYDIVNQAQRLYPEATIRHYPNEQQWPDGEEWPSELTSIEIPRETIAASLGMTVTDQGAERRFTGTLIIGQQGLYRFRLPNGALAMSIDGLNLSACADLNAGLSAGIGLAEGVHRIEVVTDISDPQPVIEWNAPGSDEWGLVPAHRILKAEFIEGGFLGTWRQDPDNATALVMHRIDGTLDLRFHDLPMSRPYHAGWSADLAPPQVGVYTFSLRSDDETTLTIGDTEVISFGPEGGEASIDVPLEQGLVPLRVTYVDRDGSSRIELTWKPPGGEATPIPPWFLTPVLPDEATATRCS